MSALGVAGPIAETGLGPALDPAAVVGPALGIGWAVVVVVVVTNRARRQRARRPRPPAGAVGGEWRDPVVSPRQAAGPLRRPDAPVTALGAALRRWASADPTRQAGTVARAGDDRRRTDEQRARQAPAVADRRTGWAALVGLLLLFVAPPLAAAPVAWALAAPAIAARREQADHEARLHDQLPDLVDLVALTTSAGLPVRASLLAIGDRPGGPLGAAVASAAAHLRHGGTTADSLAVLAAAGPPVRALVDALVQHDRYGTPLLPALDRVAVEARARRRRRSEEAARRLPVTLLFPLVLTTFPAFVLLTIVPLIAGSLGSLSLDSP